MHPPIRHNSDEVIWRHRLGHWHRELNQVVIVFAFGVLPPQDELVMKQYLFTVAVLDKNPETLCVPVVGLIPNKVRGYRQLDLQQTFGDWLDLCLYIQPRKPLQ